MKRCCVEEMMSSRDTSSENSTDLGDEVCTPCILWSDATLEEDETHSSGMLIEREDVIQSSSVLI
jgi:hypothetical protein